jgi:hypothetical protein
MEDNIPFSTNRLKNVFETGSHHVAQADLDLMIILALPPKFWDYRCDHHSWLSISRF